MKYLPILFLLCTSLANAQSIEPTLLSPTSMYQKDANQNTYLISIGEPAITTMSASANILTQGFLQPYEILLLGTTASLEELINVKAFPNPTSDIIRLEFESLNPGKLALTVTDELGRILYNDQISIINGESSLELNVTSWSAGIYFLKAVDQTQVLSAAFKFIKI